MTFSRPGSAVMRVTVYSQTGISSGGGTFTSVTRLR
jgi:hypothetical protein